MRCWPQSLEEKWKDYLRYKPHILAQYLDEDNFAEFEEHPEKLMYVTLAEEQFLQRKKKPGYALVACRHCQKEGMWNEWGLTIHLSHCVKFEEFCTTSGWEQFGKVFLKRGKYPFAGRKLGHISEHLREDEVVRRNGVVEFCAGQKQDEAAIIHDLIEDWKVTSHPCNYGFVLVKRAHR